MSDYITRGQALDEVDRLRAALERIAGMVDPVSLPGVDADIFRIARAALDTNAPANRIAEPASEPPAWQPIATAPEGRKIIVHYLSPLRNSRVVMACWYGGKSLVEGDDGSGDYDYAPPGWYEEHDSDGPILPLGGKPTHWLPVPAPPRATEQS